MKLARGIVSILMFMLLFSFMSLPVFAMQTQSNGRTGSSEQSSVGSKQNVSGTMERLFHLRILPHKITAFLKAVRFLFRKFL